MPQNDRTSRSHPAVSGGVLHSAPTRGPIGVWRIGVAVGIGVTLLAAAWFARSSLDWLTGADHRNGWRTPTGARPNVLLISIDMLRSDHVHAYGAKNETTPNLDQLAREGVLFENAFSTTSWTLPAHASLFTSVPGMVHGCTDVDRRLDETLPTLAEKLHSAGYATAGFFSGPFLHPAFGLGRGFDHYEDCTSYREELDGKPVSNWADSRETMKESHEDITSPTVLAAVREWMSNRPDQPFFLFVHWWDAHYDFIPPPPYDTMFDPNYTGKIDGRGFFQNQDIRVGMEPRDLAHLKALYDGEIAWTDHHIGLLLDDLRRSGQLNNTLVVVVSDHGTEFFEHGRRGHRLTLFDESLHIPLIMRYPPAFQAGMRRGPQVRIVDVAPTILDIAGVAPFEITRGRSLVALARTNVPLADSDALYADLFSVGRKLRAVRTDHWKIIQDLKSNALYYFDLRRDPGEHNPEGARANPEFVLAPKIFQQTVADVQQVALRAAKRRDALQREGASPSAQAPAKVQNQLKGLGYLSEDGEENSSSSATPTAP